MVVRIGQTEFRTALFPKDGRYLIPLKADVRRQARIDVDQVVEVSLNVGRTSGSGQARLDRPAAGAGRAGAELTAEGLDPFAQPDQPAAGAGQGRVVWRRRRSRPGRRGRRPASSTLITMRTSAPGA